MRRGLKSLCFTSLDTPIEPQSRGASFPIIECRGGCRNRPSLAWNASELNIWLWQRAWKPSWPSRRRCSTLGGLEPKAQPVDSLSENDGTPISAIGDGVASLVLPECGPDDAL